MGKIMQESNKEMIVLPVALLIGLLNAGFFEETVKQKLDSTVDRGMSCSRCVIAGRWFHEYRQGT
jgi:hypothetical protein